MNTLAEEIEHKRDLATILVDRAEDYARSRMVAYRDVAAAIGASASWVRKFVNSDPAAGLNFAAAFNIERAYSRLCERIEAEQETERKRILALRRSGNAAVPSHLGMADVALPEMADGKAPSPKSDAQD